MKILHYSRWKDLANDCLRVMLVSGTIGIALKFTTLFDKWIYFPFFPNILDATFLISAVSILGWKAHRRQKQQ